MLTMTTRYRVEMHTFDTLAEVVATLAARWPDLQPRINSPGFYDSPGSPGLSVQVIGTVAEVWHLESNTVHTPTEGATK